MSGLRRLLLALLLLCLARPALAAEPDPAGLWVLRSEGATLFLIEVQRTPQGWSGSWSHPAEMKLNGAAISKVKMPAVKAASISGRAAGAGSVELVFDDPRPGARPDIFTIVPIDDSRAELNWSGVAQKLLLERPSSAAARAVTALPGETYRLPFHRPTNPEMTALFDADQAARTDPGAIDWEVVAREDDSRRKRTKALLDSGALNSADDFYHAAFIFQHGGEPGDYLIAHALAVIATARGRADATWIAAATLDRYLQAIGQKQIYGTQYSTPDGQPTTQEPYDRTLLSDALRAATGVPAQAEQEKRRAAIEARTHGQVPAPPKP
jgi:hypothetical protein